MLRYLHEREARAKSILGQVQFDLESPKSLCNRSRSRIEGVRGGCGTWRFSASVEADDRRGGWYGRAGAAGAAASNLSS